MFFTVHYKICSNISKFLSEIHDVGVPDMHISNIIYNCQTLSQ